VLGVRTMRPPPLICTGDDSTPVAGGMPALGVPGAVRSSEETKYYILSTKSLVKFSFSLTNNNPRLYVAETRSNHNQSYN